MSDGEDRRDQLLRSARKAYEDLRLIERAMSEDWPIRGGHKQSVAGEIMRFIQSYDTEKKAPDENYFRAVNIMLRMTQQNLSQMDRRTRLIPKVLEMECLGVFGPPVPKGVMSGGDGKPDGGKGDDDGETLNVVPMGELVQQLVRNDPEYIDYCREIASSEDRDTGDVREPREQGLMAFRKTFEAAGQGTGGHSGGTE